MDTQPQQAKGFVDSAYLQTTAELLQQFKLRSYAWMQVQPGQAVLDVGCGPATDTIPLGRLVGPAGQAVGVDHDQEMIAEADRRALDAGVNAQVSHRQASVSDLPFAANSFDASRSERVFQHLQDPQTALAEMVRVTKPAGHIVVWDADWGTLSIDTGEPAIERNLVRVLTESNVNNGFSGRQLYRLFKQQGLDVVNFEANTLFFINYPLMREIVGMDYVEGEALATGLLSHAELMNWRSDLEQAHNNNWFFASVTGILIAGTKNS